MKDIGLLNGALINRWYATNLFLGLFNGDRNMIIYSRTQFDASQQTGPYAALYQFIAHLNAHHTHAQVPSLVGLFNEAINPHPLLAELKNKTAVKVLYPCSGADPVTAFLFSNTTEATLIDNHYFFDPNTELTVEASEFLNELLGKNQAVSYSGYGDYDITSDISSGDSPIIKINANTTYNDSLQQTGYFLLLRLKIYLGAEFEEVALIDPQHPDLGFIIKFYDKDGNKKVLTYFQRSFCADDSIFTCGGLEEGSEPAIRQAAIKKNIANADVVLFKAAQGFPEGKGAKFLLNMLPPDTKIVSDSPRKEENAKWLENYAISIAQNNNNNLQFISHPRTLGYSTFSKGIAAMVSDVATYTDIISNRYTQSPAVKNTKTNDSFRPALRSVAKYILFEDAPQPSLSISKEQLTGLIVKLAHVLACYELRNDKLNIIISHLLAQTQDVKLDFTTLVGALNCNVNQGRFLTVFFDQAQYLIFPQDQNSKKECVEGLFKCIFENVFSLNKNESFVKTLLEKIIFAAINAMKLELSEINCIAYTPKYELFKDKGTAFKNILDEIFEPLLTAKTQIITLCHRYNSAQFSARSQTKQACTSSHDLQHHEKQNHRPSSSSV